MSNTFELKMVEKQHETYSATYQCINCGKNHSFACKKGVLIADGTPPCPNCGCTQQQIQEFFSRQKGSPFR